MSHIGIQQTYVPLVKHIFFAINDLGTFPFIHIVHLNDRMNMKRNPGKPGLFGHTDVIIFQYIFKSEPIQLLTIFLYLLNRLVAGA